MRAPMHLSVPNVKQSPWTDICMYNMEWTTSSLQPVTVHKLRVSTRLTITSTRAIVVLVHLWHFQTRVCIWTFIMATQRSDTWNIQRIRRSLSWLNKRWRYAKGLRTDYVYSSMADSNHFCQVREFWSLIKTLFYLVSLLTALGAS